MVLKDEIIEFCKTTSIKGIPRAARAEQRGLRVTWSVLVVLLLVMASYMMFLLVSEYLEYPTYTITLEKEFDGETDKPIVPTLTLCNEYPFSSLKPNLNLHNVPSLENYLSLIDQYTQCTANCTAQQNYNSKLMRTILKTPNAYFQNLGLTASEMIGHSQRNFVLSCKELTFLGLTIYERGCTELVNITLVQDMDYFNCYRVSLSNNYSMAEKGFVTGIQVVLYLDNIVFKDSDNLVLNLEPYIYSYGVIAVPHHPNGMPFPALDGIQIPAGASTRIHLTMIKNKRLEPPYGNCKQSDIQAYELLKICYAECMQANIRKKCNCTDSRMVVHKETPSYPFCLKINKSDPQQTSKNFKCATSQLNLNELITCRDNCVLPCKEYHYRSEMSTSKWPNPTSIKVFYDTYIAGKDYEKYFDIVRTVIDGNCSTTHECRLNLMLAQNMLENNFLQVHFVISDIRYEDHEEKRKILWADFISKMGSILNLWAGITIVAILEMCETLFRIIQKCLKKKQQDSSVNPKLTIVQKFQMDF